VFGRIVSVTAWAPIDDIHATAVEWPSEGLIYCSDFLSPQPNTALCHGFRPVPRWQHSRDSWLSISQLATGILLPLLSSSNPNHLHTTGLRILPIRFSISCMAIFFNGSRASDFRSVSCDFWPVNVPLVLFRMLITLCRLIPLSSGGFLKRES